MGVPTGESFFFDLTIDSRCFLLRLFGRGLGETRGFSGDRSFFFMVTVAFFFFWLFFRRVSTESYVALSKRSRSTTREY
jgi:hypothetical protein